MQEEPHSEEFGVLLKSLDLPLYKGNVVGL